MMSALPLVRDYMSEMAVTIPPEMDAYEAMDLIVKKKTTGLPVVDEDKQLVGFLTDKDCLRLIATSHQYNMTGRRVKDIMSGISQALQPDNDMLMAAMTFLSTNFSHMPVLSGKKIVGSMSRQQTLSAIQQFYNQRGKQFANGKNEQIIYDHPSSIAQLQGLAGTSNREQMASVLHGRYNED